MYAGEQKPPPTAATVVGAAATVSNHYYGVVPIVYPMSVLAAAELHGAGTSLGETLLEHPGARVELQTQASAGTGALEVEYDDFEAFESSLRSDPTLESVESVTDLDDRRVFVVRAGSDRPRVTPRADELGIQVLKTTASGGYWRFRMRAPDREALRELREFCTDHDLEFRITNLASEQEESVGGVLTPAQEELLVAAYEAGYFEQPRAASLDDLADELGISSSAASGRLRRGVEALVESTVVDDDWTSL